MDRTLVDSNVMHFIIKILDFETHPNSDWFEDDINIAREFVGFLDSYSYDKGREKLLQWQKETIRGLKIDI